MILESRHHLTYCTNIHPGESWQEVFRSLQTHLPEIKRLVVPQRPMGIGLRLSNRASVELLQNGVGPFQNWLDEHGFYVFTMNGFPYGGFHGQSVKDSVHHPDWTTVERLDYTLRLFQILSQILPQGTDGGISTSPLSYKPWIKNGQQELVLGSATHQLIELVKVLYQYHMENGILMHLDIEPEPDGLLENSDETIQYFQDWLIPKGQKVLGTHLGISEQEAREIICRHVQVCYDICHFAVVYESPQKALQKFEDAGINIGKIQISAALKKDLRGIANRQSAFEAFNSLNEPTYLHQVVARDGQGRLHQYDDLPGALEYFHDPEIEEWRTHFHVPVFEPSYGVLQSTQQDIMSVLSLWKQRPMTNHLEVETYTWEVLPPELQKEINSSISRELQWVLDQLRP